MDEQESLKPNIPCHLDVIQVQLKNVLQNRVSRKDLPVHTKRSYFPHLSKLSISWRFLFQEKKPQQTSKQIPNWWCFTLIGTVMSCAVWNVDSAACCELVIISEREKQITRGGNTLFDCSTWVTQACLEILREGRGQSMFTFGSAGRVGEVVIRNEGSTQFFLFWDGWFHLFGKSESAESVCWFLVFVAWVFCREGRRQKCSLVPHKWKEELLWGSGSQGPCTFLGTLWPFLLLNSIN